VRSIAFSPDGKYLAGGFPGGTAVIWDVETGQVTGTLTEQIGSVLSVAFSPDGTLLATTGSQVTALWNLSKSRVEWYLKARYSAVAFSNDGRWVATASQADKEGQTLFTEAEKNQLVLWNLSSMAGPTAAQGRGPRSPDAAAQVARLADELGVPLPGRQGRIPKAGFDVIPDEQQQTVPFSLGYPVSDNPLNEP
jgi:WD40 repeat protein